MRPRQRTALAAACSAPGIRTGGPRAYLDLAGLWPTASYVQARTAPAAERSPCTGTLATPGARVGSACASAGCPTEELPGPPACGIPSAHLELFRAGGEPVWQARALGAIGWCYTLLGDPAGALPVCQEAVGLHRELGDPLGEAAAWESLGDARRDLGQHQEAVACPATLFRRAVAAGLGEHYYHAEALTRMGDTYQSAGQVPSARAAWQQALAILTDNHLPDSAGLGARL